ncbi:MAG TPA: 7-cyano-7-deazaguanine synthase QueC [Methanocellaceae archaeon]
MRSIALLSSGLDSAVAFKMTYDITGVELAITFDYGQRAVKKEVERAKAICDRFQVRHEVIKLPWLKAITATALVNKNAAVPTPAAADLDDIKGKALETAHLVWVPNRNGAFINIAAAYADALKIDQIVCGFNAEEGATFPDNTPAFVDAINKSLHYSTENHVKVIAPVIALDKEQIIRKGIEIDAPLDLSWSCYYSREKPCGTCESCMRRARAFKKFGSEDPSMRR